MTKKQELKWRLKDLPDAVDVAELVDKKVITPEEAREILFSDKPDDSKKIKEQDEEIKFLRDLCDKLAAKSNGWTTIVREYNSFTPRYPTWYSTYGNVVNTVSNTVGNSLAVPAKLTGGTTYTAASGTQTAMLSKLN